MMPIRVLLADDHPLVRFGIRKLLDKSPGIMVVGEASDGVSALQQTIDLKPDVVVLDIEMPGMRGDEVARQIRALHIPSRILVLSVYHSEQHITDLLASGVDGYVAKHEAIETIVQAIRGVMSTEDGWLSPIMAAKVMRRALDPRRKIQMLLTDRESEVLKMVALGKTDPEIAQRLNISERTVRYHLHNMYRKLGVNRRCEAIVWALREGVGTYHEQEAGSHFAQA
jgi:NarL family two-component system response regulator LiaR